MPLKRKRRVAGITPGLGVQFALHQAHAVRKECAFAYIRRATVRALHNIDIREYLHAGGTPKLRPNSLVDGSCFYLLGDLSPCRGDE